MSVATPSSLLAREFYSVGGIIYVSDYFDENDIEKPANVICLNNEDISLLKRMKRAIDRSIEKKSRFSRPLTLHSGYQRYIEGGPTKNGHLIVLSSWKASRIVCRVILQEMQYQELMTAFMEKNAGKLEYIVKAVLEECIGTHIQELIEENCAGCNKDEAAASAHECETMTQEELELKYFDTAIKNIDICKVLGIVTAIHKKVVDKTENVLLNMVQYVECIEYFLHACPWDIYHGKFDINNDKFKLAVKNTLEKLTKENLEE